MSTHDAGDPPRPGAAERAKSQPLDPALAGEELRVLRDYFRDEAGEVLDALAARLLGGDAPDARAIAELMRGTHTLKGSAGTVGLGEVTRLAHELEDVISGLGDGRLPWSVATRDQLVAAVDAFRAHVDALGPGDAPEAGDAPEVSDDAPGAARVAAHLAALRALYRDGASDEGARPAAALDPDETVSLRPGRLGLDGMLHIDIAATDAGEESALPGQAGAVRDRRREARGVLRVDAGRIDLLMDSVGELVFDRTRIERRVRTLSSVVRDLGRVERALRAAGARPGHGADEHLAALTAIGAELAEHLDHLRRTTADLIDDADALRHTSAALQTEITRVRMSSARSLFQTLARQLRAISRAAGKSVSLVTSGDDTEFDRTVAERVTDPLVQLLRNAVAHGIEAEDVRLAAGKRAQGEVRIDARQEGSQVVLELSDDGAGIDPAAVRERLVRAGGWSQARAAAATDEEVLAALFDAGVSMRDEADELAGRGVGLDAVRATVARLGGEIRMASTPGQGTRFLLRLPVSTAMSHAMLFDIGAERYAVPLGHLAGTAHVACAGVMPDRVTIDGSAIPLVDLRAILGEGHAPAARGPSVVPFLVIQHAGRRVAIACDAIAGAREIVVKELGPLLSAVPLYAGATLSGTGKVQLILDPAALLQYAATDAPAAPLRGHGDQAPPLRGHGDQAPPLRGHGDQAPPLRGHGDQAPPLRRHGDQAAPGPSGHGGRVLVADDSPSAREAMQRMLTRSGYTVDSADDGASAWDMVQARDYDLVVTDIDMPGLDGFGLLERMRQDARLSAMPVIVVSASDTPAHRARARELSVKSFVTKPLTPRKVLDALGAL